ncbi:MAG: RidA family protein [Gemmatimonadota bacterium]|nr:RidA family protein [Gemmatimonadota bacterium]
MTVRRAFSGAPWEDRIGYCRAVRIGPLVWVTGTASVTAEGSVHAPGDPYRQALRCFEIIEEALNKVGARTPDVVRTRMFVTDIAHWPEVGRAHKEVFGAHPPTTTMVEVSGLIDPEMLVEIEADAYVDPA